MFAHSTRRSFLVSSLVFGCLLIPAVSAFAEGWNFSGTDRWGNTRAGDYFQNLGNGTWREVIQDRPGRPGRIFYYREVERAQNLNDAPIILYDASRRVRIAIWNDLTNIQYPGTDGFVLLARGRYVR